MNRKPRVAVVIGSNSDVDRIQTCLKVLRDHDIPHERFIMSAHREPDKVRTFAKKARSEGYKVIIAGAGLSNALAGACASYSDLPVIGLPFEAGTLGGMDALLSTVQMPPGVPVASVGIGNGRNAALMAVRILSI